MRTVIAVIFTSICLLACSPKVTESYRVPNAAGNIDAVVAIRETDATVATPTEIYLVAHDAKLSDIKPVFRADKLEGLSVEWETNSTLRIKAKAARVFVKETKYTAFFGHIVLIDFKIDSEQ